MRAAIDIYGVRACGELKLRMMYDNPDAIALFQFCATRQVPVTVHIDYPIPSSGNFPRSNYWYGGGIAAFERALQQCPDTVFLGHAPGFWAHISAGEQFDSDYYPSGPVQSGGLLPAMLRKYPNLYGDISANSGRNALSRDAKFGREFVLEFQDRSTRLFVTPGYHFRIVDVQLTNFHMPRSTLLLLIAAFAGREKVLHAYQEAINKHYRFLSFGDAMLML